MLSQGFIFTWKYNSMLQSYCEMFLEIMESWRVDMLRWQRFHMYWPILPFFCLLSFDPFFPLLSFISFWMGILFLGFFMDCGIRPRLYVHRPLHLSHGHRHRLLLRPGLLTLLLSSNKLSNIGRRISSFKIGEALETLTIFGSLFANWAFLLFLVLKKDIWQSFTNPPFHEFLFI